jgi:hypothetical protein
METTIESKRPRALYINNALAIYVYVAIISVGYLVLQAAFGFPDILRQPVEVILQTFQANQGTIVPAYYAESLTGILFIIFAVLTHQVFVRRNSSILLLTTVFGILAGYAQYTGFIRWVVLKPYLAQVISDPQSSEAALEAVKVVFETSNRYIGMAVGEHFGFMAQGLWQIGISYVILKEKVFDRRLGWVGLIAGLSILIYSFEQIGFSSLAFLVVPANAFWACWLLALATSLLRVDLQTGQAPRVGWIQFIILIVIFLSFTVPAYL